MELKLTLSSTAKRAEMRLWGIAAGLNARTRPSRAKIARKRIAFLIIHVFPGIYFSREMVVDLSLHAIGFCFLLKLTTR